MKNKLSLWKLFIQAGLIYIWCTNLKNTDSFYSLYILCSSVGLICICYNMQSEIHLSGKTKKILSIVSGLFSLSIILANYSLFQPYTVLLNILNFFLNLAGGWILAWHILQCAILHFPIKYQSDNSSHPVLVFCVSFFLISSINLIYLFLCKYPGVAPQDTVSQLNQVVGLQPFSNWTPYWHTVTIKLFYDIGYQLFGDVNAAIATYSATQALFASGCYAYVIVTLYQMKCPKSVLAATFFLYALLPYNIIFSITIGKDNLFGLGLLLMLTSFWRIISNLGQSRILNFCLFAAGSLGFSVWRTNGWYVYVLFFAILLYFPIENYYVLWELSY